IGFGLVASHVVSTAVGQRFERGRGLAVGIATSGSTAGQLAIVPLVALLLTTTGWRWSFVAIGARCAAMAVFALRTLPARSPPGQGRSDAGPQASFGRDLASIVRRPAFHILFWSYFVCGYTTSGVIETHFLPYASFCGFGPVPSATAYGLLSAVNLAGMIA